MVILHAGFKTLKYDMVSFFALFKFSYGKFNTMFCKFIKTKKIVGKIRGENIWREMFFFQKSFLPPSTKIWNGVPASR